MKVYTPTPLTTNWDIQYGVWTFALCPEPRVHNIRAMQISTTALADL